jgi:hypothetical protein
MDAVVLVHMLVAVDQNLRPFGLTVLQCDEISYIVVGRSL